jgi:hypothetical protein
MVLLSRMVRVGERGPFYYMLVLILISGDPNAIQDFNLLWISDFKKTNAYQVWDRVTDPLLFDIVEPRSVMRRK